MLAYFSAVEELSQVLQRALRSPLASRRTSFSSCSVVRNSRLKAQPLPATGRARADNDIGVRPAFRFRGFTILWQDDNGGLEVTEQERRMGRGAADRRTFIVNLGNIMQIWTNGRSPRRRIA